MKNPNCLKRLISHGTGLPNICHLWNVAPLTSAFRRTSAIAVLSPACLKTKSIHWLLNLHLFMKEPLSGQDV
jgi:hypothetical protein